MDKRYFSEKVVEWYELNKRTLPWREKKDAYRIWLSEIILQQTRVIQGLPYYFRFIEEFPTITDLAKASEQKVLRLWQGLGYYTRARNLHKCAKEVVKNHQGEFPNTFEKLKSLPGIGDYTAAAIASIAFHEPVAVVDGNVFRVLSRLFGIDEPVNSPQGKKIFTELANELINKNKPGDHNQAVMEFGALYCTPKNPACPSCIFKSTCFAASKELQSSLPVKIKSKTSRKRYFYYVVIQKGESLLMKKRDQKDIWNGLYDFMLVEKTRPVAIQNLLKDEMFSKISNSSLTYKITGVYRHILTHQVIISRFIMVKHNKNMAINDKNLKFYSKARVEDLPKPILISQFLNKEQFL